MPGSGKLLILDELLKGLLLGRAPSGGFWSAARDTRVLRFRLLVSSFLQRSTVALIEG